MYGVQIEVPAEDKVRNPAPRRLRLPCVHSAPNKERHLELGRPKDRRVHLELVVLLVLAPLRDANLHLPPQDTGEELAGVQGAFRIQERSSQACKEPSGYGRGARRRARSPLTTIFPVRCMQNKRPRSFSLFHGVRGPLLLCFCWAGATANGEPKRGERLFCTQRGKIRG